MRLRWKVIMGLVAVATLAALVLARRAGREQRALEETRRDLRAKGFKVDLTEFDFSTSDELRARITALTNANTDNLPRNPKDSARHSFVRQVGPELMKPLARDVALPLWKQAQWPLDAASANSLQFSDLPKNDLWPMLRQNLADDGARLNAACAAVLSGTIRVPLDAGRGSAMLLPHLSTWRNLTLTLGSRAEVELHDGDLEAAWTNMLAATRLVTAWEIEPVEVSHLLRTRCATMVFNITWQALQTNGWSDEQLSQLQREWESVDFFKGLPETAAFARAAIAQTCQMERREPLDGYGSVAKDFFRSPKEAWANLSYRWQTMQYRQHGSFEDEKDLLLHYCNREQQLAHAVRAQTWLEMRQLPGATNTAPFSSKHRLSRTITLLNSRQMMLRMQGGGQGLMSFTAETEARRRLVVTAIALERFHKRHGDYPKSLPELAPEFLGQPPFDFMDGQPLRYRLSGDGHFVLYSVGLDCVDNGGEMQRPQQRGIRYGVGFGSSQDSDIVWPRPASDAEIEAYQREQIKVLAAQTEHDEVERSDFQWSMTAEKQLQAEKLLAAKPAAPPTEPNYRGQLLAEVFGNKSVLGTNTLKISDLLILKQIRTGAEPETITFDVPITYDLLTNLGRLALLVDPIKGGRAFDGYDSQASWVECHRATNGNCLLVWNTIYEAPGLHALQLALAWSDRSSDEKTFATGLMAPFTVSNLCQFSLSSAYFKPELGPTLRAKLPEPRATYSLEITSPAGELLKTISGSTSSGLMTIHWDLVDDRGVRRTNSSFNTVIHVKLADSGRAQTLRGP
jgi:hypothetical protein